LFSCGVQGRCHAEAATRRSARAKRQRCRRPMRCEGDSSVPRQCTWQEAGVYALCKACRQAACLWHHGSAAAASAHRHSGRRRRAAAHGCDGMTQGRRADGSVQQHWRATRATGRGAAATGIAALSRAAVGARMRLAQQRNWGKNPLTCGAGQRAVAGGWGCVGTGRGLGGAGPVRQKGISEKIK
jgi:hypothetical protein